MDKKRKRSKAELAKSAKVGTWRDPIFWRDLVFYFLFFSYIGHFIEMAWTSLGSLILGTRLHENILANPFEPYTIYGAGAVLCILVVRPLVKKFNHNIIATYLIATLICGALELVSSLILTLRYGYNPYWGYAGRFMNLGGHICLGNCLLFGLLATTFLRLIYPYSEKLLRNKKAQLAINIILALMIIMFAIYYFAPIFIG